MANLVPLHIDKDTGDVIATGGVIGGGGGGGGGAAAGYLHDQLIPSTTWSIAHGQATTQLICQIYTGAGELIIPDGIEIIDNNTVHVTFTTAQAGLAHILFFEVA